MAWLAENAPKIHKANADKGFYDQHPPMAERVQSKVGCTGTAKTSNR